MDSVITSDSAAGRTEPGSEAWLAALAGKRPAAEREVLARALATARRDNGGQLRL